MKLGDPEWDQTKMSAMPQQRKVEGEAGVRIRVGPQSDTVVIGAGRVRRLLHQMLGEQQTEQMCGVGSCYLSKRPQKILAADVSR